jgi:CheY-like chemotaxis protein
MTAATLDPGVASSDVHRFVELLRLARSAPRDQAIDALVLDLEMPIMDGPTLMRTLRERTKW